MAFQAETTHSGVHVKPFWKQYRLFHATLAQFCYTGAQVAIAGMSSQLVSDVTQADSLQDTSSTMWMKADLELVMQRLLGSWPVLKAALL